MNIDKFGNFVHKRMRISGSDFADKALIRSQDGNFNFQMNRLKGVSTPIEETDAANKGYVDIALTQFCSKEFVVDFLKKRENQIINTILKKLNGSLNAQTKLKKDHLSSDYISEEDLRNLKSIKNDKTTSSK